MAERWLEYRPIRLRRVRIAEWGLLNVRFPASIAVVTWRTAGLGVLFRILEAIFGYLSLRAGTRWLALHHFFLLRAFFAVRVVFSIKKSSAFFPSLIAATSQRGFAPRPAHSSPDGPLNFGATFVPFKLPRTPRATLPPIDATELPSAANCFSRVER